MSGFGIKKESTWKFETSATGGLGIGYFAGEGGKIYLRDPKNNPVSYIYGGAGGGLSAGIKLPKFGGLKIQKGLELVNKGLELLRPAVGNNNTVSGVVAPKWFKNAGIIYVLDTFDGDELTASDFQGVCISASIGGGLIAGVSGEAMLLGMSPGWLAATAISPIGINAIFISKMISTAKAVLITGGVNAGLQASVGVAAYLGGLY